MCIIERQPCLMYPCRQREDCISSILLRAGQSDSLLRDAPIIGEAAQTSGGRYSHKDLLQCHCGDPVPSKGVEAAQRAHPPIGKAQVPIEAGNASAVNWPSLHQSVFAAWAQLLSHPHLLSTNTHFSCRKANMHIASGIGLKPAWGGTQAIQSFVRQSMAYIPQTPDKETRIELIKTLQTITEGKVSCILRPQKHCIHCCSMSCAMPVGCVWEWQTCTI